MSAVNDGCGSDDLESSRAEQEEFSENESYDDLQGSDGNTDTRRNEKAGAVDASSRVRLWVALANLGVPLGWIGVELLRHLFGS